MPPKIAIVGGGITAGLAANIMGTLGKIKLFHSDIRQVSMIPEIVPRRAFFDSLCNFDEKTFITRAAPVIRSVIWQKNGQLLKTQLESNNEYFVYDKSYLAALMTEHLAESQHVKKEVVNIAELNDFDLIFDCRGQNALIKDPSYQTELLYPARTACRYFMFTSLHSTYVDDMCFWSEKSDGGIERTFFNISVGNKKVIVGCSFLPSNAISDSEIFKVITIKGIHLEMANMIFNGYAEPKGKVMKCALGHVIPLGDSYSLACPLKEYGTLKALSQLIDLVGGRSLLPHIYTRHNKSDIDPHLPQELFQ